MLYLRQLQGPGTPFVKLGLFCQDDLRPQVPAESALTGIRSQLEVEWRSGSISRGEGMLTQHWFQEPMDRVRGGPACVIL